MVLCIAVHGMPTSQQTECETGGSAGELAWCAAGAQGHLWLPAAGRPAVGQQTEADVCGVPQPEHGHQVGCSRS